MHFNGTVQKYMEKDFFDIKNPIKQNASMRILAPPFASNMTNLIKFQFPFCSVYFSIALCVLCDVHIYRLDTVAREIGTFAQNL